MAQRIFRLNLQLSTETLTAATPEIEALGLEPKAFFVLDGVEAQPYPATLAHHLSMPKPTITAHLKALESAGLVTRAIDPADLRRHRIALTTTGRVVLDKARGSLARHYGDRLARLDGENVQHFARLLETLTREPGRS
ncbi:MAG: MarR family winged helix-turn-helix transcriptional regulator [Candidatus Devosia phytovorans]|uniref:MarR family winged helix-turn-helix transcriptional regulator n=1 Tax=Candidatus Devosia phytovorans TaxID=3121372 RepID=A0AAJ5VTB4_9HYPH|nr:MarR family winged helix-turn-helix transcriptional regulator [Devosia sp.]WEK02974.1 MAG: MarR family winged helix-turn-helix transcriptional regulator [Devosia sp.]